MITLSFLIPIQKKMEARLSMQKLFPLPVHIQKIIVAVFFAALLLIGLITAADYGISSDEHREIQTLRMNEREYINAVLGTYNEFEKYFESVGVYENFREYTDRDYGCAVFYPVMPFLVIQKVSPFLKMVLWHCYIFLLFMLGCWALYSIILRLFHSRVLSCTGVLLLYLSPRFFAEGHYNNKDIVLVSLVFVVLWLALLMMEKPTYRRALLLGLVGALITNLRIIGLCIWGLACIFVLLYHIAGKTLNRKTVLMGVLSFASLFIFYYILTPNAWGQPWMNLPNTFSSLSRFSRLDDSLLFEGNTYRFLYETLPWYYLFVWMGVTTPIFLLCLIGFGQIKTMIDIVKRPKQLVMNHPLWMMALCTLIWGIPMLYFILCKPIVYNGWRHFYFIYAPLILLAVYGVHSLWKLLRPVWAKSLLCLALAVCLAFSGVGIVQNHPHQQVYFNALAGDAEMRFDGDYWYVSLRGALEKLLASSERDTSLPLTISGFHKARLESLTFHKRQSLTIVDEPLGESASYVFMNPGYTRGSLGNEAYEGMVADLSENYHVLFDLKSYGHVIMVVWERNEPVAAISPPET